jgi:hypothetical protein
LIAVPRCRLEEQGALHASVHLIRQPNFIQTAIPPLT